MATPLVNPRQSRKHRIPLTGIKHSLLVTISKRVKTKSLFVPHFSLNITCHDIEESLHEECKLSSLICKTFKTKYNT
jgi:hypothetical protein